MEDPYDHLDADYEEFLRTRKYQKITEKELSNEMLLNIAKTVLHDASLDLIKNITIRVDGARTTFIFDAKAPKGEDFKLETGMLLEFNKRK